MENERKTRGSELEVQDHDDSMDLAIAKSTYQGKKPTANTNARLHSFFSPASS